jgi:hypothetical protein
MSMQRRSLSNAWPFWRGIKGFFSCLSAEEKVNVGSVVGITKPILPLTEIVVLVSEHVRPLVATCCGKDTELRRDYTLFAIMFYTL